MSTDVSFQSMVKYVWDVHKDVEDEYQNIGRVISIEGITSLDLGYKLKKSGASDVLWESGAIRLQFNPCLRERVQKLCGEWRLYSAKNILEVGSGKLTKGESYVSALMPEQIKWRVTHSDLNRSAGTNNQGKFITADVTKLSEKVGKCAYDVIYCSCVLDTLNTKRLKKALKEIYESLKDGGLFISFSDLSPYLNTLSDALTKEGKIIFPLTNSEKQQIGLQVLNHEHLSSYIESTKPSKQDVSFLKWYSELNPSMRDGILNILWGRNRDYKEMSYTFSEWVKHLEIEGMESVLNTEFFHGNLRKGLKEAGFNIRVFNAVKNFTVKDQESRYNYYAYSNGLLTRRNIYVLAPGKTYFSLTIHLVVAQK